MLKTMLLASLVALLLAFAVEPTTSTELDIREGRGVAVVHAVAPRITAATTAGPLRPMTYAIVRTVLMLSALCAVVLWSLKRTTCELAPHDRTLMRGSVARRGPPARV